MISLSCLVKAFLYHVVDNNVEIYNEFSLQHELGIFLRASLPDYKVQFERNIAYFASKNRNRFKDKKFFEKRELDIAVFSPDISNLLMAIELKFPRKGEYPEQMYKFCKDIAFAEQLKMAGFCETALLIFVDDELFYKDSNKKKSDNEIYKYFRGENPKVITKNIPKPTGKKEHVSYFVSINGSYSVEWEPLSRNSKIMYALIIAQ